MQWINPHPAQGAWHPGGTHRGEYAGGPGPDSAAHTTLLRKGHRTLHAIDRLAVSDVALLPWHGGAPRRASHEGPGAGGSSADHPLRNVQQSQGAGDHPDVVDDLLFGHLLLQLRSGLSGLWQL